MCSSVQYVSVLRQDAVTFVNVLTAADIAGFCRKVISSAIRRDIASSPTEASGIKLEDFAECLRQVSTVPWVRKFTATPNYLILPPEPIDFLQEGWR
jgi:hypothetical protein